MLAPCTTKTDHEVGETPLDVVFDGSIYEGVGVLEEVVDAAVLEEEIDDSLVASGEGLVGSVTTGVVEGTAVKDKPASVSCGVLGDACLVGKAADMDGEAGCGGVLFAEGLNGRSIDEVLKEGKQGGQGDGQCGLGQPPAEVVEGGGNTLEEMGAAFIEATETVGA